MGSNSKENQRRFAFNREKFRKSRNKSPRVEKLEVEVPQANRSAENWDNSANKVQWKMGRCFRKVCYNDQFCPDPSSEKPTKNSSIHYMEF